MWGVTPSDLWDWAALKAKIAKHGLRNSLLLAPMPTASTSQILGFNECFEPYTSNIYSRRVLAGEFQVVNPWLLRELVEQGLWNDTMKNRIIAHGGSIQNVPGIPDRIKKLYKTVWEISQKAIIDMAADRGAFICQSQSLNIHLSAPTSMHFYGWKKGLKTGTYYLRTKPASSAVQFTLSVAEVKEAKAAAKRTGTPVNKIEEATSAPSVVVPTATATTVAPEVAPTPLGNGTKTPSVDSVTQGVGKLGIDGTVTQDGPGIRNPDEAKAIQDAKLAAEQEKIKTAKLTQSGDGEGDNVDPGFAAALERQRLRQLEADQLVCSLENKEACLMCSG